MTRSRISEIIAGAADRFGMTPSDLTGKRKEARFVRPRWAAMWVCRRAGYTTTQIGTALNRDHSTVSHGTERCDALMAADGEYRDLVEQLDAALGQAPRFYRHGSFQFRSTRRAA